MRSLVTPGVNRVLRVFLLSDECIDIFRASSLDT